MNIFAKSILFAFMSISAAAAFAYPPSTAPFTVEQVIEHAETYPENYEMDYLKTDEGKAKIQSVIDIVNSGTWPEPDINGLKVRWNRHAPEAKYNMSAVADFVSEEYKASKDQD